MPVNTSTRPISKIEVSYGVKARPYRDRSLRCTIEEELDARSACASDSLYEAPDVLVSCPRPCYSAASVAIGTTRGRSGIITVANKEGGPWAIGIIIERKDIVGIVCSRLLILHPHHSCKGVQIIPIWKRDLVIDPVEVSASESESWMMLEPAIETGWRCRSLVQSDPTLGETKQLLAIIRAEMLRHRNNEMRRLMLGLNQEICKRLQSSVFPKATSHQQRNFVSCNPRAQLHRGCNHESG